MNGPKTTCSSLFTLCINAYKLPIIAKSICVWLQFDYFLYPPKCLPSALNDYSLLRRGNTRSYFDHKMHRVTEIFKDSIKYIPNITSELWEPKLWLLCVCVWMKEKDKYKLIEKHYNWAAIYYYYYLVGNF